MSDSNSMDDHVRNVGILVFAIAGHEPGRWGDCSINHPIMNVIDAFRPAHELIDALVRMSPDDARHLVGVLGLTPDYARGYVDHYARAAPPIVHVAAVPEEELPF